MKLFFIITVIVLLTEIKKIKLKNINRLLGVMSFIIILLAGTYFVQIQSYNKDTLYKCHEVLYELSNETHIESEEDINVYINKIQEEKIYWEDSLYFGAYHLNSIDFIEDIAYKNKVIFDGEFQYYTDIVPKLIKANDNISRYIAMKINFLNDSEENTEGMIELIEKKRIIARDTLFEFHDTLSIYAVFIDKDIYDEMLLYFAEVLPIVKDKDENIVEECVSDLETLLNTSSSRKLEIIDSLREKMRRLHNA